MIIEEPDLNSSSAPISKLPELSEEEQRNEINRNYLPNLSNYQQISIKLKDKKEKDIIFNLYPDANYIDDSKKGFYIFYNNNLTLLKELYDFELTKLIDTHSIVLYHIKDFLKKLDKKYDEDSYYNPIRIGSYIISLNYQTLVDKARNLANNLIKIKNIEEKYGTDIKRNICEIIVNDDPEEIFKDIKYEEKSIENEEIYLNAESRFGQLENYYKDNLTYITELEKLLDEYLGILGENPSTLEKKNFLCFILNRASYYLSNAEKQLRENLDLALLKKLDRLRRKINNLLLKYRYKFEENKKSILEIEIEKFKTLKDAIDKKSIYLEKTDVQKFISQLEEALQNKVKLYIQLFSKNYHLRNDYSGLIITEVKKMYLNKNYRDIDYENVEETSLREYEIKEIYK